jgi:hypothetical protein
MTKYEFRHIPTPDGRMPRDPTLDWDLGDWYDPYPMMQEAKTSSVTRWKHGASANYISFAF